GDYYLLNNTYSTGILIEFGFLSSEYDRKRLLDDKYLYKLSTIIQQPRLPHVERPRNRARIRQRCFRRRRSHHERYDRRTREIRLLADERI
ncbi:MAG: N-acetylmuramoyl-L-alanine amidase, partial [Clostridia bacterium]|nr:N-acetylmuramoyl-L-alanine amidase [Clostridia bacterium]